MRMGANKIGIQQEAASLSAIFPFLKETMRPHFIFQANTLPQKGIADLLIESYGLEEYSNRELERAEEIFEKGYNTATELLDRLLLENGTIWR